jgi:hypothetical protein
VEARREVAGSVTTLPPPRRTVHLSIRLSPAERERLREAAQLRGLALSTFLRMACLRETLPRPRSDSQHPEATALLVRALGDLRSTASSHRPLADAEPWIHLLEQALEHLTR